MKKQPKVIAILGPTASGKTDFSIKLSQNIRGEIINCDSMQVYQNLRILSARPTGDEQQGIAHHLFGCVDGRVRYNAAQYASDASCCLKEVFSRGHTPVLVGGTGLYLKALKDGLSPIPEISPEIREQVKRRLNTLGLPKFFEDMCDRDPLIHDLIRPSDTQRLLRAAEVLEETGESIVSWQSIPPLPAIQNPFYIVTLIPPREIIYTNVNARFERMVKQGALEEVQELMSLGLDPTLPVMKAHGVPELMAYIRGEMSLDQAIQKAQAHTRHYVKRQLTWLRHQIQSDLVIEDPQGADIQKLSQNLLQIG